MLSIGNISSFSNSVGAGILVFFFFNFSDSSLISLSAGKIYSKGNPTGCSSSTKSSSLSELSNGGFSKFFKFEILLVFFCSVFGVFLFFLDCLLMSLLSLFFRLLNFFLLKKNFFGLFFFSISSSSSFNSFVFISIIVLFLIIVNIFYKKKYLT